MPKVLHVIARINRGGTARYLENLVPGLQELGWEVLIVTGSVQHGELEDPVVAQLPVKKVKYLGRKIAPIQDLLARKQIKKTIREFQPDIIQTHTFKAGLLARTIKLDIPLIHTYHGHLLNDPEFSGMKLKAIIWLERFLANRAVGLLTTGNHVIGDLKRVRIGVAGKYTSILPNPVSLHLSSREHARAELGIDTKGPVLMWMGRLVEIKNPKLLLEIAELFPDSFFAVFGEGPLLDNLKLKAPKNVHFLGWIDANLAFSAADQLLVTSFSEGLSNVVMEAISINFPTILTDISGNIELVGQNPNVKIVKHSAQAFASAIASSNDFKNKLPSIALAKVVDFPIAVSDLYFKYLA
jgi:glycosyltransferase involved in cell wall biosynthesis